MFVLVLVLWGSWCLLFAVVFRYHLYLYLHAVFCSMAKTVATAALASLSAPTATAVASQEVLSSLCLTSTNIQVPKSLDL